MNKYEIMIQRFDCDFQLELESKKYNISKSIENGNVELLDDIELMNKLAWLIRNGKAKIDVENE